MFDLRKTWRMAKSVSALVVRSVERTDHHRTRGLLLFGLYRLSTMGPSSVTDRQSPCSWVDLDRLMEQYRTAMFEPGRGASSPEEVHALINVPDRLGHSILCHSISAFASKLL